MPGNIQEDMHDLMAYSSLSIYTGSQICWLATTSILLASFTLREVCQDYKFVTQNEDHVLVWNLGSFHPIWKVSGISDQQSIVSRLRDTTGIHYELEFWPSYLNLTALSIRVGVLRYCKYMKLGNSN